MATETTGETAVILSLLHDMLADEDAGWHIGTFGAVGEFHHVDGDPPPTVHVSETGGETVTDRGAIRLTVPDGVRPVAYEGLSGRAGAWTHGVAFCLPDLQARMSRRTKLTELGPDYAALRGDQRQALLFDVGLGAPHVDICVRTDDPALIRVLRREQGSSILTKDNPAMAAIVAASPHRVFASRLGRVEVYQPIPGPESGMRSPVGPHTHLMPDLLRRRRTHSANTPLPSGWLSGVNLHPRSPLADRLGQPRPFDEQAFRAFQGLVDRFGPPGFAAEKRRIWQAVRSGSDPAGYTPATTRIGRTAARVALRQMCLTERDPERLAPWLALFDRSPGACPAET